MPNGGPRPDCMHCKWRRGEITDSLYCDFHKINLANPIYAFCPHYVDPEPEIEDWLDKELDRSQLQTDKMYLWMPFHFQDEDRKIKHVFDYVVLTSIVDYGTWTRDKFLDVLEELAAKKREEYRAKGYKVD
jgi:hypothetical protein